MIPTHAVFCIASLAAALGTGCSSSDSAHAAARNPGASATPAASSAATMPHDSLTDLADRNRIQGDANATVWVIEASDFQCPYCRDFHEQTYPQIINEYVKTGKVRFAYLNFPLEMHQHAQQASEAAMCAALQGKFWPMHDSLFASQPRWAERPDATPVFDSLAVEVGANQAQWRQCTQGHAMAKLIEADKARSAQNGVRSTPSFFVGSQMLEGAQPFANFKSAIDAALAKTPSATRPH